MNTPPSRSGLSKLLFIITLPFTISALAVLIWISNDFLKVFQMKEWVVTPAKILALKQNIQTKVEGRGFKRKTITESFIAARYEYIYETRKYTSSRVSIFSGPQKTSSYPSLYEKLERCLKESVTCECYVNPKAPNESVLTRSIKYDEFTIKVVLALFFSFPLVLFMFYKRGIFGKRAVAPTPEKLADFLYLNYLKNALPTGISDNQKNSSRYTVQISGRTFSIEYIYEPQPPILVLQLPVVQKLWLKFIRQTGPEAAEEIQVQNSKLNDRYRIYSNQRDAATHFLNLADVKNSLELAFDFDRFEIYRGRAIMQIINPKARHFDVPRLSELSRRLLTILQIYERPEMLVVVSKNETESALCPFCRGDINVNQEPILECKQCQTKHHEKCWMENGQCTTWGCAYASVV